MKRFLLFVSMLMLCVPAFASVGIQDDGSDVGQATNLNIKGETTATFDGSTKDIDLTTPTSITTAGDVTFRSYLISIGRVSASSSLASCSTNVGASSVPYYSIRKYLSGVEATTLPNGYNGQVLRIFVLQTTTGGQWTITPANSRSFTSLAMTAAKDSVTLLYVNSTQGWTVIGQSGSAVVTYGFGQ